MTTNEFLTLKLIKNEKVYTSNYPFCYSLPDPLHSRQLVQFLIMFRAIGWFLAIIFYIFISIPVGITVYGIAYFLFTFKFLFNYVRRKLRRF